MTDISEKALALLNEVWEGRGYPPEDKVRREDLPAHEALYRAIEQHEAFKQEVSDAVFAFLNSGFRSPTYDATKRELKAFIIPKPKPDPLVETLKNMDAVMERLEAFRAELVTLELEIREKGQ